RTEAAAEVDPSEPPAAPCQAARSMPSSAIAKQRDCLRCPNSCCWTFVTPTRRLTETLRFPCSVARRCRGRAARPKRGSGSPVPDDCSVSGPSQATDIRPRLLEDHATISGNVDLDVELQRVELRVDVLLEVVLDLEQQRRELV